MTSSLVGSEMCIRDSHYGRECWACQGQATPPGAGEADGLDQDLFAAIATFMGFHAEENPQVLMARRIHQTMLFYES
eukprot:4424429-Prorocentrum_lima.AAC.1